MRSAIERFEDRVLRGGGTGVLSGCAAGTSAMAMAMTLVLRVRSVR